MEMTYFRKHWLFSGVKTDQFVQFDLFADPLLVISIRKILKNRFLPLTTSIVNEI